MKYSFAIFRQEEKEPIEGVDDFGARKFMDTRSFEQEVMRKRIDSDEMVELMQHLWDMANRRK